MIAVFVKLRPALLGTLVALVALVLAALAAGPALRFLVGPPVGFGSDYTSRTAYVQAVVAQCVSLALSYFLFGMAARNGVTTGGGWPWAFWAANPLTVGLAYWLLRLSRSPEWPYEYTSYHGWLVLTVLAPLLFAPCIYLGARLTRRHS